VTFFVSGEIFSGGNHLARVANHCTITSHLAHESVSRARIDERGRDTTPQPPHHFPIGHLTLSQFLLCTSSYGQTLSARAPGPTAGTFMELAITVYVFGFAYFVFDV